METDFKLVELTENPWESRWTALSEIVKSDLGVDLSTSIRTVSPGTLAQEFNAVIESGANACRVDDGLCVDILPILPRVTHQSLFVGACPFLVNENGQWWPRPLLDEAFKRSVTANLGQIDLDFCAFVAGVGGAAKLVVSALATMGFGTINVSAQKETEGLAFIEEMKKKYFRVKFKHIPYQGITTLPGIHSIAINTTPLGLGNELLDELYFFNFLKAGGVVADLTLVPSETPLIMEAKQWGARHLSGDMISAERDALMIENALHRKIDVAKYQAALRKQVDAVPFDPSPYQQRFRERGT